MNLRNGKVCGDSTEFPKARSFGCLSWKTSRNDVASSLSRRLSSMAEANMSKQQQYEHHSPEFQSLRRWNEEPATSSKISEWLWKHIHRAIPKLSVLILLIAIAQQHERTTNLGTAAIASVTDVLSPIMPFLGGVDLRKEDYWHNSTNLWEGISQVSRVAKSAYETRTPYQRIHVSTLQQQVVVTPKQSAAGVLSGPLFCTQDEIASLTLSDVVSLFEYAFKRKNNNHHVKHLLGKMEKAVEASRGGQDVKDSQQMDALWFAACMRIFAEWRVVRQVPQGYKGFAVGMNLGHKDIVQNIAKIESAVQQWIEHRRQLIQLQLEWEGVEGCTVDGKIPTELVAPTIPELMQYEIDMGLHPRLPVLKDATGSMGLLWVRRQLQYQTLLFENVLHVGQEFASGADAVAAAYKQVYDRYHGWAVQKIFNYSFQSAPEAEVIFRNMNVHRLREVQEEARHRSWSDTDCRSNDSPHHIVSDNDFVAFFQTVVKEVEKLFQGGASKEQRCTPTGIDSSAGDIDHETFIRQEMTKDAYEKIESYLQVIGPLLKYLDDVFDELNMNDPTKV